ncbi:MAG: hypothetical protein HZB26_17720 [Candidatus Hydrogenedentes bacterium]|nr:hypothetical protein [Candidatus Hydrogenedentota bacterium]
MTLVEKAVDLGPHAKELSNDELKKARQDWLELDYFQTWASNLSSFRRIDANSSLGEELIAPATV